MISRFLLLGSLALSAFAAPPHVALLKEAAAAAKAGDNANALAKVGAAAKLRPDYPRIQLNLARLNAGLGRTDDALAALERLADMGLDLNIAADPALTSLAALPRFQAVVTRLSAAAKRVQGELAPFRLQGVTGILESGVFDPGTEDWYFGDVRNRCIWKRGADGALRRVTSDDEKLDGVFKLLLTPDRRTLWAGTASIGTMAGAGPDEEGARSALIAFDFASGKIAARYPAPADGRRHLLGDFILAADGALYATDSFSPVIWRLPAGGTQLEPWLEHDDFLNLQGLAFSADGQNLFVADYSNGIWRIDLATKAAALLVAPPNATFFGIDGLYAVPGGLLAIQNGVTPQRVLRIDPSTGATEVVAGGYPAMTDLSLGTIAAGRFHFIADSGWALYDPPPAKAPRGPGTDDLFVRPADKVGFPVTFGGLACFFSSNLVPTPMKTLLALLTASVLSVAAAATVTENLKQTYPLAANGSIHLDNVNGYVEIVAWDKAEVALEAVKKAKDEEALSHVHLRIDSTANRLTIKTEYEKKWKFWDNARAEVRYKLMVPAGASLDKIDVVNCGIRVTGVKGSVNLDSVNGSVEAEGLAGAGRFDTVNGSIMVAYATMPDSADDISLDTVNGSCTLKLPAGAAFRLDADTVNGHVSCDFPITLEKSGRHTLRGTVAGGTSKVKLDSVNGGLTVAKAN